MEKIVKIGIFGSPSTGKSTLAEDLAYELRKKHQNVILSKEYARDFITKNGLHRNAQFQTTFFNEQTKRDQLNSEVLISDSPNFLALIYAYEMANFRDSQDRDFLTSLFNSVMANQIYDYLFYLPKTQSMVKDAIRVQDDDDCFRIERRTLGLLNLLNVSYHKLSPINPNDEWESRKQRVEEVLKIINNNG